MLLVTVAWLYVVLMVAVVQATGEHGSLLGAFATVAFYGLLPIAIAAYLFFSPARRRARQARERAVTPGPGDSAEGGSQPPTEALAAAASAASPAAPPSPAQAHRGDHAPGDAVAPVGEEP